MNQDLYWHIELYSGEIIKVKPDPAKIKFIQEMIAKQEGSITTPTRSIIIKDIRDFRVSDERYANQKLMEASAPAFREPEYTKNGIKCRLVKKSVSKQKWENYYSRIPSYHLLGDSESFVMIAFTLPTYLIDHQRVQELTQDEERSLSYTVSQWR